MKNAFFKTTLILLIGGFFTKFLGFIIKIFYTKMIGVDGVALYSLVMPTYSLLITLANFNIQMAISKKISAGDDTKKTLISSGYIMFILDCFLILLVFISAKFLSVNLLHNKDTYFPLLACSLSIPFISIGYIIKGYFYGKQKMMPHMISNVIEQLVKLLIVVGLLPKFLKYGKIVTVSFLLLVNIFTELTSILVFFFFLPKKINLKKISIRYDKEYGNDLLALSVPSIIGRLVGNVGYFFEPILLSNVLLKKGLSNNFIIQEYGVYNAYSVSLLLFPSFFITAISNALLPEISKLYSQKRRFSLKRRIYQALGISLIVGVCCTFFIFWQADFLLEKLYGTSRGLNYINILAPFFILFYLESPMSTILVALNRVKCCMFISTTGIFFKLLFMVILAICNFKMYSLVIAEIINIVYVTLLDFIFLKRTLKEN